MRNKIIIVLISGLLFSCSTFEQDCGEWPPNCNKKPVENLPYGNLNRLNSDSLNSEGNEVAPIQIPNYNLEYGVNYSSMVNENIDEYSKITTSAKAFKDTLRTATGDADNLLALDYLTKNVESITFLDNKNGLISLSHPPTKEFADFVNLPIKGMIGGTDIFEFRLSDEEDYIFESIEGVGGINTLYWESHPFIMADEIDGIPYKLLLWSSDRHKPYTLGINLKGDTVKLGETDIYYSFFKNNEWTSPKRLPAPINSDNSSEGTPFIYCNCRNPILMYSSNKNDVSSDAIVDGKTEDFDIFYTRIKIDFDNELITVPYGVEDKAFPKSNENDYSNVENFRDSTINTNADDRFPFVEYPFNTKQQYLYLSSNRNDVATPFYNVDDSVVVSNGKFDIYKFPLPFNCIEDPLPIALEVHFIDPLTNQPIQSEGLIASLNWDSNEISTIENTNPAIFEIEGDKQYSVKGGTSFTEGDNDSCGNYKSMYFDVEYDTYQSSFSQTQKFELKEMVELNMIDSYKNGVKKEIKGKEFIDTYLYNTNVVKEKKLIPKTEIMPYEDKYVVEVEEIIKKNFKPIYLNKVTQRYITNSNGFVSQGNISSIKTRNNGLRTTGLNGGDLIRDTIYLARVDKVAECLTLEVKLIDKCNPEMSIIDPVVRLFDVTEERHEVTGKFLVSNINDVYTFSILKDRKYEIYGGSNFYNEDLCRDRNERYVHEYYCSCENYECNNIDCEAVRGATLKSELTLSGEISTFDVPYGIPVTIQDTVNLCLKTFEKEICRREFVELQKEYRRKVPYFQTGFWEVNTLDNYRRDLRKLNNDKNLYTKNVTVPGTEGIDTSGAKWIELQRNNTRWKDRGDRLTRIWQYESFAKTVDTNLNQMAEYINDDMLDFYEKIVSDEDCDDCSDNKFVIIVEAWSDYRPVKRGWYIPKDKSEKVIKFAESSSIRSESSLSEFEPIKVTAGDDLGENNDVLSNLRAYFGYKELYERLQEYERFNKYSDDEVLLPHELVDKNGNLIDNIDEKLKNAKIVIIAKGYSTSPDGTSERPMFSSLRERVDIEAYRKSQEENLKTYFDLDDVRSIQVIVEQLKYQNGRFIPSDCCYEK